MSSESAYSILVVDDNPVMRVLCSRVLTRDGYQVLLAEDGVEALRLLKEQPADLVLLDVMMPGLSGFDVLEAVRRLYPRSRLPVLMVTAKDQSNEVVRAFKLGADDYITKPLDVPVMMARIRAHLRPRAAVSEPAGATMALAPGSVLEDRYRLESEIGRGSFGTVYRATHLALERPVAVKLFNRGIRAGGNTERFRREASSACRIDHVNAARVLDLSITPNGVPYMAMELLEGWSLAEELRREGCLDLERCLRVLIPICDVLAEAHALGIVHRDVKPQNIFLHQGPQGEVVKVLDFGIAKLVDGATFEDRSTADGLVGTPTYMAPERFSGSACTDRADVYSLGVTLYEMLTGRRPFTAEGDLYKLILMHMEETPVPPRELRPELPAAVERLILEALSKDQADRPSVSDFAARLASAAGPSGVSAKSRRALRARSADRRS